MNSSRRVAITGIGIWSCIGRNIKEVEESLRIGRSGIGTAADRTEYGYHCPLTGIVERPDLRQLLDRRQRAAMSEQAEYAFMASREALMMAGLLKEDTLQTDIEAGCVFGNDSSALPLIEAHEVMREHHDSELIGSGNIFRTMNSTVTMNLSSIFALRGASFSVSAACASSSHAIGLAAMMIRQGMQDVVLCGGAQEVNKYAMSSFDALGVFAVPHDDDPTAVSRPFDAGRTGLVPSGGAAALVLEDYDHALSRGRKILAEVAGYGASTGAGRRLSSPAVSGVLAAMRHALSDAGLTADDIDYINAHATGTPQGDSIEAEAITQLLGKNTAHTWVSSTKSMTGHECWMAGASEAIYSTIMMQRGFVAPNINLDNADEAAAHLRIPRVATEADLRVVMSNSFGFGGTNSTLILSRNQGIK